MNNIIHIVDDLYVVSDDNQWMLARPREVTKDGVTKTHYLAFKYYGSLEQCVKALGQYLLRTGNARNASEFIKAADEISALLSQKFTAAIQVKVE